MKKIVSLLKGVFVLLALFVAGLYVSGYGYLFELGAKVFEIGRTTAGLEDYIHFEVREIPKSDSPQPWAVHKNYNIVPATDALNALHKAHGTVAFMIIKNDSIWHEQYFDGFGKSSKTNSFSMVKTIVAASLAKAIEEGHVESFDQKAKDFLPWLTGPYADEMTVGNLATMSSGLEWKEDYDNLLTITPRTYITRDITGVMQAIPIVDEPGKKFIYQSGSTQLLSLVLTAATGETISELVRRYFWNPLGAQADANWRLDSAEKGVEKSYCCFNSNARDFARFAALFKNGGVWNGEQLIDPSYVQKSITPQFENGEDYGYGWWLGTHIGKRYYSMRGHNGQYVIVFPEDDVIVVRLGHRQLPDLPGVRHSADYLGYMEEAFAMLHYENNDLRP
ncbi:MAG: serine hydrolase domain-containing protein [Flavobacteriaceae bacterium]